MIGAEVSLLSLLAAIATIDVRTQGRCPSAADVVQRLEPILPQAAAGSPLATDVAAVEERADGTLSVSLSLSNGGLVGRRELPRAPSCADQADAVAVTLAVWEAALHPDITLALDRLPPDASRASASQPPPSQPRAPPPATAVETRAASAPPARAPLRLRVGVAFGVAGARAGANTWMSEAQVDGAWSLADDTWRLRLSARGTGEQTMDVPPGDVYWQRLSLAAAVDRVSRLGGGADWKLVLGAGPVAGAVRLRGAGFAVDRRATLPDVGAAAAVRLERRVGRWSGWLALTATWWLRSQRLQVVGLEPGSPAAELPQGEAAVALGASFSAL